MRYAFLIPIVLACCGCGGGSSGTKAPAPQAQTTPVKITQFYASERKIPKGLKGSLCYGVEHASKVELTPAVDVVWPAPVRCIEIAPKQNTTYTLTAYGEDGSKAVKSVEVSAGSAPPRVYDLSVNSVLIHPGEQIVVCFKVENAKRIKAGPGEFDAERNCIADKPRKTTVYRISALGDDNQIDTGTVTVKVR
jgi:hypothetical protein